MGGICPCPKRKDKTMSYDVNEETFEIEENIASPAVKSNNPFQMLAEEGPINHQTAYKDSEAPHLEPVMEGESAPMREQSGDTKTTQSLVMEPPAAPMVIQEPKKKEKPAKKKVNLDDYRFIKEQGTFRVKKVGSLGGQQFNIDGCKGCTFFIFDNTANVYIDDS